MPGGERPTTGAGLAHDRPLADQLRGEGAEVGSMPEGRAYPPIGGLVVQSRMA